MRSAFGKFLAYAAISALPASPLSAPARAFDPVRIHADYQAGEFEKVIAALEAFRESGRRCRKADSVFLEKHLAVVYAADPGTRERGRYHMLRMLDLDPEADLLDMFVGEAVDGIFEKVRKESRARRPAHAAPREARAAQAGKGAMERTAAAARPPSVPRPARSPAARPAPAGSRPALPAAHAPRPAFPGAGPAPRLKPWNLDDAPAPRRAPRRPGVSRAPADREVGTAEAALPAWDLDRVASAGPAMGLVPAAGTRRPFPRVRTPVDAPAARDLREAGSRAATRRVRAPEEESAVQDFPAVQTLSFADSGTGAPHASGSPAPAPASRPWWTGKRFLFGGTAVAAVLGLAAYYVGSQEWTESASRNRTYGVAAKPDGN